MILAADRLNENREFPKSHLIHGEQNDPNTVCDEPSQHRLALRRSFVCDADEYKSPVAEADSPQQMGGAFTIPQNAKTTNSLTPMPPRSPDFLFSSASSRYR